MHKFGYDLTAKTAVVGYLIYCGSIYKRNHLIKVKHDIGSCIPVLKELTYFEYKAKRAGS